VSKPPPPPPPPPPPGISDFLANVWNHYFSKKNVLHLELFAALYHSFVTAHPLITTGCCKRKVCHNCQCEGHHEAFGKSCSKASAVSMAESVNMCACPKCKATLVKVEGCSDVTCPSCWHRFEWRRNRNMSPGSLQRWLRRMRGSGESTPVVGTRRGLYVRTATGWARV
jgi:hypothetical protein